ncbi:hypothetical protein CAOG_009331 [Capsaspora owczarzaki ATCC 30864]|uniref:Uncharacterized protein n=1 Tax=Capsaspora owczarzaki (strain ATCC 30864) TaxID=595528 RepID=A0A0D2U1X9_CAPO3|nr:hypothetical protein CAOG_009331 [Capsaspora owczarzaki ATCC 30864]
MRLCQKLMAALSNETESAFVRGRRAWAQVAGGERTQKSTAFTYAVTVFHVATKRMLILTEPASLTEPPSHPHKGAHNTQDSGLILCFGAQPDGCSDSTDEKNIRNRALASPCLGSWSKRAKENNDHSL